MLFFDNRLPHEKKTFVSKIFGQFRLTSFAHLNIAQFLGAMNDNIFKLLIVYCFISVEGTQSSSSLLAAVGAVYVIPFLLFSQTAGMVADRYSKRTIIVCTKVAELIIMLLGMIAFAYASKILSFIGLFLLAAHSAFFGPCKYGIVPEIVPTESISKANGYLTSFTYTAIIFGTFLASFLTDITERGFVLSVAICAGFSLLGLFTSLHIQKTAPLNAQKKVSPRFITELIRTLRVIRNEPSLLTAVIGSAFFLFIGSFIQLNMIPFAINILHLSDVQGGYLFLLTALGIGAGSIFAGKLSGKAVELGLVPMGGLGITACCFLLDYYAPYMPMVLLFVFLAGFFGGVYLVPLDSYIQVTSPKNHRGQIVASTNFLGFVGVLCSAGMLYLLSEVLHIDADHGFTVMGFATIGIVIFVLISMSGYIVRFCSFIVSRIHFPVTLQGKDVISISKISFFFVPHSFWPWAAILLASQRKRMRLFTIHSTSTLSFFAKIAKMCIPVLEASHPEDLLPQGEYGDLIHHSISRGTSIGIFCSKELFAQYAAAWHSAWKSDLEGRDINFFSLIAVGQEQLTEGKIKTELSAKVSLLK